MERISSIILVTWLEFFRKCIYLLLHCRYTFSIYVTNAFLLVFWAYFEIKIAKVFLWRKSGFEHIEFNEDLFSIKKNLKGYGKIQKFDIREIKVFMGIIQSQKNFFAFMDQSFWVIGGERIYFTYKNKDIIFGKQIDIKEEKALLMVLNGALNNKKSKLRKIERKSVD